MPEFRRGLSSIPVYTPGKPIDEVARELGLSEIVKLASNECPLPPFPEVQAAIAAAAGGLNRYPETSCYAVVEALAAHYGLPSDHLWVGGGSTQLLGGMAAAVGGPGTTAVFGEPSFVMYRIAALLAGSQPVAVPLDADFRHDLDAMADAVGPDTRIVFVCNPNNPTGTHVPADAVTRFVERMPDHVLVVVDEAYAEYVTAGDYATAIPHALERDNVVVTRTFSKVYGLAGLRIGYALGRPGTLDMLRRSQNPFAVTSLAQIAAIEALRYPDRVEQRVKDNAAGREWLEAELHDRGVTAVPSQANFVFVVPDGDPGAIADGMLERGVIIRLMGPYLRISVGTEAENERFIAAWDEMAAG